MIFFIWKSNVQCSSKNRKITVTHGRKYFYSEHYFESEIEHQSRPLFQPLHQKLKNFREEIYESITQQRKLFQSSPDNAYLDSTMQKLEQVPYDSLIAAKEYLYSLRKTIQTSWIMSNNKRSKDTEKKVMN